MNPALLRLIGILLLVAAVAAAILNLHRVANLGMPWLGPLLLVFGAAFVISAKSAKGKQCYLSKTVIQQLGSGGLFLSQSCYVMVHAASMRTF